MWVCVVSCVVRVVCRGFHCVPWWRDVYMVTISAFGVIGLALSWIPYFSQPHTRFLRTCTSLLSAHAHGHTHTAH